MPLDSSQIAWLQQNRSMSGESASPSGDTSTANPVCAAPDADPPEQAVAPGQPNQSVAVVPPASGVAAGNNPYGGTPLEQPWTQGFKDGSAEPDRNHPAPSPYTPEAQTAYAEGVLAGQDAAKGRSAPNQCVSPVPSTPGAGSPAAAEDNSTGARFIKVFEKVGEKYGPDVVNKLKSLNVAELIAFAAVFILIEDTPVGWAGMLVGAAMIGKEISDVIDDVSAFIRITADPNGDLDTAATRLSDALSRLSIDALIIFLTHKASGKVKPFMKPPTGFVDVLTPEGQIIRVPADKLPDANNAQSRGSGSSGGNARPLDLKVDRNTGLPILDGEIDLSTIDEAYLQKLSPDELAELQENLQTSIRNRQAGQQQFGETTDDGGHRARIGQEVQLLNRVTRTLNSGRR